jgi:hypothetical protein
MDLRKLQKKAPNALERLDAELKSAPVPSGRNGESIRLAEPLDVLAAINKTECPTLEQLRRDPVRDEVRGAGAPLGLTRAC